MNCEKFILRPKSHLIYTLPLLLPTLILFIVWGCTWHWSGDLLASGGMDHTCKLWDVDK